MNSGARHNLDIDPLDDGRVSVPVAAKYLGVSVTLMHELLDKGRIPYEVPNKQRRVNLAEVRKYRDARTHKARKPRREVFEDLLAD